MAGELQPLDEKFPIVGPDGRPTVYFIKWAQQRQIDITEATTTEQVNEILVAYLIAHPLQEGDGIQITPSGNLSDSPTIAADVQEILDQVTVTRGSILYRGALGWSGLAPGTSGWFLKSNGAGADPAWAIGGAGSVAWGDITGTLADQTDLQDVLDFKLTFYNPVGFETWTQIDVDDGFTIYSPSNGGQASFDTSDPVGRFIWGNFDGTIWGNLGYYNPATLRISLIASTAIEFDQTPYVNTGVIFHEGNLSFGSGLDYTAGVLTVTGGVLPMVDGSIPPVFIQNPDGSLIYAPV